MGTTATAYAEALAAEPAPVAPVAVLAVTAVLLLLLGAVFWSFLRRAQRDGVAPLAVDRLDAPGRPEPPAPAVPVGEATAEDSGTAAAIADEIAEGGPVLPEDRS